MTSSPDSRPGNKTSARTRRSLARLNAVQALYQLDSSDSSSAQIVEEFVTHRLGQEIEGEQFLEADADWFGELVLGADARKAELDDLITGALDKSRSMDRLEMIMRALLRAATYEMVARIDVPAKVVINEYVDIAHAFFGGSEPAFVNGVLDKVGHRARPDEFKG